MRTLSAEGGFIKPVLIILILIFLVYAGFQFAMPYYRYSALKSDAIELARISLGKADRLYEQLVERAEELDVPLSQNDVFVERRGKRMHVIMSWSENVDIMGLYQKKLHFNLDITE